MINEDDKEKLLEIFGYLKKVHIQQNQLIAGVMNIYSDLLYVDNTPQLKEIIENYLNALNGLGIANTEIIAAYGAIVDGLGS